MPETTDSVTLTPEEQEVAKLIARRRGETCREKHRPNLRVSRQTDFEIDLQGAGAEIAFAKLCNVWPDLDVYTLPPYDARLPDGRTVDVNATKWESGHLIVSPWKTRRAAPDIYVLMIGEFPTYRFAGWLPASEIMVTERYSRDRFKGYVAGQEDLNKELLFTQSRSTVCITGEGSVRRL